MKRIIYLLLLFFWILSCNQTKNNPDKATQSSDTQKSMYSSGDESNTWTSWFAKEKAGNPIITNYRIDEAFDNQNWAIAYDNNNVMLFANRKGILTFDGQEWNSIRTPSVPYTFYKDEKRQQIYVGLANSYGFLSKDEDGNYAYHAISEEDSTVKGDIEKILQIDDNIYFYSTKSISRISVNDYTDRNLWVADKSNPFAGVFVFKNQLYVNTSQNGLCKLEKNIILPLPSTHWQPDLPIDSAVLKALPDGYNLANNDILFSIPYNERYILLGTSDQQLCLFDGVGFANYTIQAENQIKQNVLSGGINLSKKEFALSTINGGCIVVSKFTGKTVSTINYQTGLPDNEIYSMGVDRNHGLWISHQFGLSRVNFSAPITNYSSYLGLHGTLMSVANFDSTIYVSTSEGVYHLTHAVDYKEIEVLVKAKQEEDKTKADNMQIMNNDKIKRDKIKEEITKNKDTTSHQIVKNEPKEEENWLKRLKSRLFGKKNKEKTEVSKKETIKEKKEQVKEAKKEEKFIVKEEKKEIVEKKIKVLKKVYVSSSSDFIYKKIEGLNEKCKQIIRFQDRVIALSNTGVYQIKGEVLSPIIKNVYANSITAGEEKGKFYVGTNTGLYALTFRPDLKESWEVVKIQSDREFDEPIYSVAEFVKNKELWVGGENKAYRITFQQNAFPTFELFPFSNDFPEKIIARKVQNTPYFFLLSGIYSYKKEQNIVYKTVLYPDFMPNPKYILAQENITWISKNNEWLIIPENKEVASKVQYFNIFDNIQNVIVDENKDVWVVDNYNMLYKILANGENCCGVFDVFVKKMANKDGAVYPIGELEMDYKANSFSIDIAAPFYLKPSATEYQYLIEGLSKEWSKWEKKSNILYPIIPSGDYILRVKAKNALGQITKEQTIKIKVTPPFTKTAWFYLIIGLLLALAIKFLINRREYQLNLANASLEIKVMERTEEIRKQQQQITDSIQYASRIQHAILPPLELVNKIAPQHFILNKPREIVSGDYYWFSQQGNKVIIAAADCTGHGVPGAFLSMLGITFLNDIVNERKILQANEILNCLRKDIMQALHQTGERGEAKDGMDIALCVIDYEKEELEFSGAHNPLVVCRKIDSDTEITQTDEDLIDGNYMIVEIKGDKMPIGIYFKEKPFTNNKLKIKNGDTFYMFSDGFADQFGEEAGRKYYLKHFKKLLLSMQDKPMAIQRDHLEQTFEKWKGKIPQVDDILVIGVKYESPKG